MRKKGGKFKLLRSWWSVFSYIYCALDYRIYFPILSSRRFTSYYNYVTREWHWVQRYEVSISILYVPIFLPDNMQRRSFYFLGKRDFWEGFLKYFRAIKYMWESLELILLFQVRGHFSWRGSQKDSSPLERPFWQEQKLETESKQSWKTAYGISGRNFSFF